MKKLAYLCLFGTLLAAQSSCQTTKTPTQAGTTSRCADGLPVVRTVTSVAGIVHYDAQLQRYRIDAHQPGTTDVVDVGVVCGALPAAFQAEGRRVVFSGTYKRYANPPALLGGYTYYNLELSNLQEAK